MPRVPHDRAHTTHLLRQAVAVVAAFAAASTGLLTGSMGASASTSSTPYVPTRIDSPDQIPKRWGERLVAASLPGPLGGNPVTAGDLNGDGVNDYWTADLQEAVGGVAARGRVFAMSGRTNQVIYSIDPPVVVPNAGYQFGFYISSPGDLNGDNKPEIVAGTDAQNVPVQPGLGGCTAPTAVAEPNGCNEGQGQAWVFDGATGAVLFTLNNPTPQGGPSGNNARFGSRLGRAGDINGDGVPDIIVGASNEDVCNTAACTAAVAAAAATPGTQAAAGDLACGDVSPIPAGCGKNQGEAFIFSGANGSLLRTLDVPVNDQIANTNVSCTANCGNLGLAVQSPGDINGDGVPDQQVDASNLTVGGKVGQGRVYIFSGADGSLIAKVDDPVPQAGATFGFQDAAPNSPGDVNGDGVPDIYANGFGQDGPLGAGQGRAWIFDGKTTAATGVGQLLITVDDPTPELGGQFGWSMTTTDYDNNGVADFYVGQSPHHVAGATGSGGSYIFSGPASSAAHTAVLLKALELPPPDQQASTSADLGPNLGWGLAAPGDLDGDGNQDYLAGAPFKDVAGVQDAGQIFDFQSRQRPPAAAFDGSATSDLSVFRPSTGTWFTRDQLTKGTTITTYGTTGDIPVDADFDGDGIHDVAVFRPSTGEWFIQGSSTGQTILHYGTAGDLPVPADYDSDGKANVAVFRPSTGQWFIRLSTGTDLVVTFGTSGDIPVPADYDGDGRADLAVFRPSTGQWFINKSTGGQTLINYGTSGDIPVPADYDGDGKADIAVFRPSTGNWFINKSSGGQTIFAYGTNGDIPVPGDYDGDGKADIAVFRPSTGTWFQHRSAGTDVIENWGTTGDKPLPLPAAIREIFFP